MRTLTTLMCTALALAASACAARRPTPVKSSEFGPRANSSRSVL